MNVSGSLNILAPALMNHMNAKKYLLFVQIMHFKHIHDIIWRRREKRFLNYWRNKSEVKEIFNSISMINANVPTPKLTHNLLWPVVWDTSGTKFKIFICSRYDDVIMGTMAYQITSLAVVYSTVNSGADQRKHQNSASLAFVRGIHRGPVNSPHKWPVTRKMFPFDDVIMIRRGLVIKWIL